MPKMAPQVSQESLDRFAAAISAYYQQSQGRGEHCKVEHFVSSGDLDFFFAYPADYSDTMICYEADGNLARKEWKPASQLPHRMMPFSTARTCCGSGGRQCGHESRLSLTARARGKYHHSTGPQLGPS